MKSWKIPVVWQMMGVVEVVADTLEEAMRIAKDGTDIPLPDNGEVVSTFASKTTSIMRIITKRR